MKTGLLIQKGKGRGIKYEVVPFIKGLGYLMESGTHADVDKAISVVNLLLKIGQGANKNFRPAIGEPETPSGSVKTSNFLKKLSKMGIIEGHDTPPKRYWTLNKGLKYN